MSNEVYTLFAWAHLLYICYELSNWTYAALLSLKTPKGDRLFNFMVIGCAISPAVRFSKWLHRLLFR